MNGADDKQILAWLRRAHPEHGPWPEYVHFLEPDGTICSKKLLDCLPNDWERLAKQGPLAFDKWVRGEITQAEFDLLVGDDQEGHA